MSERESSGIMARAGSRSARSAVLRWSFALATLTALVFGLAGPSRAQSQSTAPKSAPPGATATKVAVVDTNTATQTATAKPAAEPAAPKGQHEGITVHGHWVIEVKNPDGKLVRRVEFENSIDPGFSLPNGPSPITVPGGASLLSGLLTGKTTPGTVGPWAIMLAGPGGLGNLSNQANAPCVTEFGPDAALGACVLFEGTINGGGFPSCQTAGTGDFCGLTATPSGAGLVLSGSATATQQGQISTVATLFFTGAAASINSFTSSTNFSGAPISVSGGQTIGVTVAISFQ